MTDRKHIDPTIYTTRPTDERLEKENRVYDLLEELSIPFVRIDHDAMNARMLTSFWVSRFVRTCSSVIHRRRSSTF